jgi:hypothetical protein
VVAGRGSATGIFVRDAKACHLTFAVRQASRKLKPQRTRIALSLRKPRDASAAEILRSDRCPPLGRRSSRLGKAAIGWATNVVDATLRPSSSDEQTIMVKLTTKEDIALLVEEASEMFDETGCVPDIDGRKVRAEKIIPRAKRYILETIDNPKASYDATIWHSPGYTLVLSWLSQKWLKYCQKLAPTVLKDADLHLPKDQRKLCLDWAADELTRQITRRRQRFH